MYELKKYLHFGEVLLRDGVQGCNFIWISYFGFLGLYFVSLFWVLAGGALDSYVWKLFCFKPVFFFFYLGFFFFLFLTEIANLYP